MSWSAANGATSARIGTNRGGQQLGEKWVRANCWLGPHREAESRWQARAQLIAVEDVVDHPPVGQHRGRAGRQRGLAGARAARE